MKTLIPSRCRAGYTLVEMVVSTIMLSILALACASVMVLAARGMNNAKTGATAQETAARTALDQISDDMKVALSFSEQMPTAVTFTVPDRTGDGQPETLRYAWAGPGSPLTRQFNGGPVISLADNVQSFNMAYLLKTIGTPQPVESGEQLLMAHTGGTGPNIKQFNLTHTKWPAQWFFVGPPANTISFKITHVTLLLQRHGAATGTLTAQIRVADSSDRPTSTTLAASNVDISTIPGTPTWTDIPISLAGLDPTKGYVLVVTTTVSGTPAYVSYDNASTDFGMMYSTTSNSGGTWGTPTAGTALQYYVYGTITAPP